MEAIEESAISSTRVPPKIWESPSLGPSAALSRPKSPYVAIGYAVITWYQHTRIAPVESY